MPNATVFVVADDPATRDCVCALASSIEVPVETFGSPTDFLAQYDRARPGCLVLDVPTDGMSELALLDPRGADGLRLAIIILTANGSIRAAARALEAGARLYLDKPCTRRDLVKCVEAAIERDGALRMKRDEVAEFARSSPELTSRERQVLQRVCAGTPGKRIADELGLSIGAIEAYRARIVEKLRRR